VTFKWPQVASATSYEASYRINGGAWLGNTTTIGNTNRSYVVDAGTHTDTVEIRVRSTNSFGSSSYASSSTTIPLWAPLLLKNGWSDYADTYSRASYTKTKAGQVLLKGLVKKVSSAPVGDVIATLPADYRPYQGSLIIGTTTTNGSATTWGRLDVRTNGDILMNAGSNIWISLETVRFVASSAAYTRTPATLLNGWSNYGSEWAPASYVMDSAGRVNLQGLVRGGTMADGTPIFNLPAAMAPPLFHHISMHASGTGFSTIGVNVTPSVVAKNVGTNTYHSVTASFIPSSAAVTWSNIILENSWVAYGGSYSTPQYTKANDGVVHMKGLVRLGSTVNGSSIGTLPPGFRPKERILYTAANALSYAEHARIDILSNGQLLIHDIEGNGWFSFDGISFVAEQ